MGTSDPEEEEGEVGSQDSKKKRTEDRSRTIPEVSPAQEKARKVVSEGGPSACAAPAVSLRNMYQSETFKAMDSP